MAYIIFKETHNIEITSIVMAPSQLQCLQKVFTSLDFLHILLCYSLNLTFIQFRCVLSLAYTQYPIMSKWNYAFGKFSELKMKS